ncbi:MAG: hypothetical protein ABH876_00070 [Patescibacteria group bacterium]|nr:hypothetical protein [Patescibacteria group bacterium]MBU1876832.1 hypothetical protein [Patescibacteria group bacterium]
MEIKTEKVYGFLVRFEQDLREGITHLSQDLQIEEAKTLFNAAKLTGRAEFEDDEDRDWTLTYIRDGDVYILTLRQRE